MRSFSERRSDLVRSWQSRFRRSCACVATGSFSISKHSGLTRMFSMLGPIVIGSAAGQLSLFFDRFFASTLPHGYMSGMNYAVKLVSFPKQIFAAAIATVLFPLLASQFAGSNRPGMRQSVVTGLRLVNFIMIPAMFGLVMFAYPITQVLFQRGQFEVASTQLVAGLIKWAAFGVIAIAANIVLTRCCFGMQTSEVGRRNLNLLGRGQRCALNLVASDAWRAWTAPGQYRE